MNTNDIAAEYRLTHWATIMREREESGLSIKAYCKNAGFHENRYFYWQKKLRNTACEEIAKIQDRTACMAPHGFTEVKLPGRPYLPTSDAACQGHICVETAGMRITADSAYPVAQLAELLREAGRPC